MIICGVTFRTDLYSELNKEGVKDSKKIKPKRRKELDKFLREKVERVEIVEFEASDIDRFRNNGINLNQIEEIGFSKILNQLSPQKAFIDSASANANEFSKNLKERIEKNIKLIVEHKADENRLPVSAASIIAKVRRDERINQLKEKYGETGSGYPGDDYTIRFLKKWIKKNEKLPECTRKTWKTVERIKTECEK